MPKLHFRLASVVLAIAVMLPVASIAQELDEITVTATKRETTEFDTPLSIETLTGEQIVKSGIKDFEDMAAAVPNFFVGDGVVSTSIIIRGAGSGTERGFEQTVGMFLDGIYMPRSRQYRNPFFDAQRVEIVRGPQAVLFGLNSTAGAVSVISNKSNPGDEAFLELGAAYEAEYSGNRFSVVAGGGVGENMGLRLAVQSTDSGDGFIDNLFDGSDGAGTEETVIKLTAVWEPSEDVSIFAKYDHAEFDLNGHSSEFITASNSCAPLSLACDGDGSRNWVNNVDASFIQPVLGYQTGLFQELDNFMIGAEWMAGEHTLTVNAAYSDYAYDFATELDLTPVPALDAALTEEYEQISGEFRVASPVGGKVEYIAGVYVATAELFNIQPTALSLALFGVPGGLLDSAGTDSNQDTDTLSVFGQVTWNLSDVTRLTLGARFNDEEKTLARLGFCDLVDGSGNVVAAGGGIAICPAAGDFNSKRSSSNFMPEAILEWDAADDTMVYGKIATSAKSGGFVFSGSAPSTDELEYGDETALSFEAGIKMRFADKRAELTAAVFHTTFEDLQLNSFQGDGAGGFVSVTRNAGESESIGLETEFRYAATEWLTLSANAAILDATFTEFVAAPCYVTEPDPDGDGICDHTGLAVPYAPDVSATVAADMGGPLGSGNLNWFARAAVTHSGSYKTDGTLDPAAEQDAYERIDANVGIEAGDGRWDISLVGKNLGDEYVLNVSQPGSFGGYIGYPGRPRTYSLQGRFRF